MPITLPEVKSGYNLGLINANFQTIEDAWDEKLDRLVSTQGNFMEQTLDMNSNEIINTKVSDDPTSLVTKEYVDTLFNAIDGAEGIVPLLQPRQQGDGVTTVFNSPATEQTLAASFFIQIDGITQRPITDYNATGIGFIQFTEAPPLLSDIDITWFEPASLGDTATQTYVIQQSHAGNSQNAEGSIWPTDSLELLPLGNQNSAINVTNITRLRVDTGGFVEGELLYLWGLSGDFGASVHNITSITANNMKGYTVVTDMGAFEFVNKSVLDLRTEVNVEGYADTLNEAIDAMGIYYTTRQTIKVPGDFEISAQVTPTFDFDMVATTLRTTADFNFIFQPAAGWSGTTTPCICDCQNNSHARGWDLTTNTPSVVKLDNFEFKNIGNEGANTSGVRWVGFNIPNNGAEEVVLINPTTRNSYVVPNGIIGDVAGSNRNVIVTGTCNTGYVATRVFIDGHTAIDLRTEEDADALVVECMSDDLSSVTLDVDIKGGYSYNCQKRQFKFQTQSPVISVRGVRLNADSAYAHAGSSIKAVAQLDVQEGFSLEVNGVLIYEGDWTYGVRGKQCTIRGTLDSRAKGGNSKFIDGNTTRAIFLDDSADVEMDSISGFGQYEALRLDAGTKLVIRDGVSFSNQGVAGTVGGDIESGPINYISSNQEDLSSNTGSLVLTGNSKFTGVSSMDFTASPNPPRSSIRCSGCPVLEFGEVEAKGVPTSTIELNNIPNATLYSPVNLTTSHAVRLEGSNGDVSINFGRNPTSISFQPSGTTSNLFQVNDRVF